MSDREDDAEPQPLEYPFGKAVIGELLEISDGVLLVPIPVPFPPGAVNAVVLDAPEGWTIVDPGLRGPATEEIWKRLLAGPLASKPMRRVIATHHHPDHIGVAGLFQRVYGAELWTTRTAWLFARMLQLDAWTEPPEEANRFMRRCGFDDDMMARYAKRARMNFSVIVEPLPLGFRAIAEGDNLTIGGRRWRAEFGQGHAPDHLVLISQDDDLVIAADQVLPTITPNIGVYPTEPEADPLGDWIAACARFSEILDDRQLILPGHGDPFRGARRRLIEVLGKHERGLARLEAHLETPRTVVECFPALYKREISASVEGLATVETVSHLNHLRVSGRARREERGDGVYLWSRA